ncbi:hypothetical protein Trydic_g23837 [Trypoxylus dichotomus]
MRTWSNDTYIDLINHYWKLVTGEIERITEDLTGVRTKLGWTLHGSGNDNEAYNFMANLGVITVSNAQVQLEDMDLQEFWKLKTIGIRAEERSVDNPADLLTRVISERKRVRGLEPILLLENFSNVNKLYPITVYVRRFANYIRQPWKKVNSDICCVTVQELHDPEMYWIRHAQETEFAEEIKTLSSDNPLSSKSPILALKPLLDEDRILRLGMRLTEAELPYQTRHPIILPKKSTFTDRIIGNKHEKVLHAGVKATLAAVRWREYWIIYARQRIKSIFGRCVRCKKLKDKPGYQPFALVPVSRLKTANPFKITGVDFAGPLMYVSTENGDIQKVYIMLLTCTVIRAVHLELVPDMTTESCIRPLWRFMTRRGVPEIIYSDNAKTSHRTRVLDALFPIVRSDSIQELSRNQGIVWKFIVERMVRRFLGANG